MAIQKQEAIVLKRIPFRETSMIATLLTRDLGKVKVLAKGIRNEKKPMMVSFEPFTQLHVVYYEKLRSEIYLLSQMTILETNDFLRDSLERFGYATYLADLVDTVFGIHDPHPAVYDLLVESFKLFGTTPAEHVTRVFEVKLLTHVGWLPMLLKCASCGTKEIEQAFFSSKQGGIICRNCDRRELRTFPVSKGAVQSLLYFLRSPIAEAIRLKLDKGTIRELERITELFFQYRLDRNLRSRQFLTDIRPVLEVT